VAVASYSPDLSSDVGKTLGEGDYLYWLVAVIAQDFKKSTVNLKSPVIVNPEKKLAVQTILDADLPIRFPLARRRKERG
jgi:flagellar assembly factor FliW